MPTDQMLPYIQVEDAVRVIVRDELRAMLGEIPQARLLPPKVIAAAVRAEMARAGKQAKDLVGVLGLTHPTVSGRLRGTYEFSTEELEKVARFLGITAYNIIESAALGERFKTGLTPVEQVARVMDPDPWAKPSRATRRRAQ